MEILREQAAIDYLSRAQSCLHPKEEDYFGGIPLLVRLISLEKIFMARLVSKGQPSMPLPMDDHGLPELDAWKTDINKAFEEVDMIRTNRAEALDPFLQEFVNASARGVNKKFEDLGNALAADSDLLKTLEEFSSDEKEFLTGEWNADQSFPFYTDKSIPGLLFAKSTRTPFSERRGKRKRFNGQAFLPGFKYIDAAAGSGRDPMFMMVAFSSSKHENLGFRIITPRSPLLPRTTYVREKTNPTKIGENFYIDAPLEYFDLAPEKAPVSNSKVAKLEKELNSLRPSFLKALYEPDFTGKPEVLEIFYNSLFKLNNLTLEVRDFSERVLGAQPIGKKEIGEKQTEFAKELNDIYNAIEDTTLKRTLQLAAAEEMKTTRDAVGIVKAFTPPKRSFMERINIFRR